MKIVADYGTHCTTAKPGRKIEWIVVHFTAGVQSRAGAAASAAAWWRNAQAGGSADFAVDDGGAIQYNPDIANRYCWAVGGKKYAALATSEGARYYGKCGNANSISVELCSSKRDRSTLNATDRDWYFTDAVLQNGAELCRELMQRYGVDAEHVIMHHQVSGKQCPAMWTWDEAALSGWRAFKVRLSGAAAVKPPVEAAIDKLVEKGVIASPDYWVANYGKLMYLDALIINMAAKL